MNDVLFDVDPNDSDAPVHASFVRRPKEEADPSEPSPFGSLLPAGYARAARTVEEGEALPVFRLLTGGLSNGDAERLPIQKAKRYDPRNHYPRTMKALEALFPCGMFWRADYVQPTASGRLITKDTLGFADIMGATADGRIVAAQVTSYGAIKAHLGKYTDPAKTHGAGANPPSIESLLRRFLGCGGRLLIFGFALPEGKTRWEHELVEVTPSVLDATKARKRKGRV